MMFSTTVQLVFALLALTLITSASSSPVPGTSANATQDETERSKVKLFEGDIILGEEDNPNRYRKRRQEANTTGVASHIWPNQTVYYTFQLGLDESFKSKFREAIEEWSRHTCIQFIQATSSQADHILFIKSEDLGCSSYVGKKTGPQLVSMSSFCLSKGHAIHEIGHAIGLWHEHSRPDRDTYIDVLFDNIIETEADNFLKISQNGFELVPDVGYDVESIMHYGPFAFSKDTPGPDKPTIRLRDDAPLNYTNCTNLLSMGQRDELSYLDKLRANKLYSCQAEVTTLVTNGRNCVRPGMMTTSMPQPTTVTTVSTVSTPTPPKRLQSGSIITLRLKNSSRSFEDLDGFKCNTNCRSTTCLNFGDRSICDAIDHRFEIVTPDDPDAATIKGGAKVALRSQTKPLFWLDCSNTASGTACTITRCTLNNNDPEPGASSSGITICDNHFFTIIGVGRQGKLINDKHSIQLRHMVNTTSYFNCDAPPNGKCKLSNCGNNCQAQGFVFKFNVIE